MYTTLAMIKRHLCIDQSFTEDDEYLLYLYEVAEAVVQVHLCANLEDYEDDEHNIPAGIIHAMLLYIGDLYNSREGNAYGVSVQQVPFGYEYLISLYKNFSDTSSEAFYQKVLDSVLDRLYIERSTGRLILKTDDSLYIGVKGKAIKRIEQELLTEAGHLYLERNGM